MNDSMSGSAGGNSNSNRRRNYVVNPAFQWKYAIIVAVVVFVLSTIMSSALYGVLHHQARMRALQPETYVAEITLVILFAGLSFAVLTAAGVGVWSFVITHRICGPLTVIGQYLREIARGHLPETRALRDKDEFKDFYEIFNDTLDALKDQKHEELASLDELRSTALSAAGAEDQERVQFMNDLMTNIETMRASTSAYLGEGSEQAGDDQAARADHEESVLANQC